MALLKITHPEGDEALGLDDAVEQAAKLSAAGIPIDPLLFRTIIETFEWQYRRTKQVGRENAFAFAKRGLSLFDDLDSIPGLTPRQLSEIRHHRGKTLAWTGLHAEARIEFEAVLASNVPLNASRLQLIRVYKRDKEHDKAIALAEQVMDAAESEPGEVSASVLLAVIQDIPWRLEIARTRVLRPREDLIVRTIVENAGAGVEQAYNTLAAVARFWSTEAPDVFDRVLQTIPKLDMERIEDDETRNGVADVMFEYGRSQGTRGGDALKLALALFEGATKSSPFHVQRKAELLIVLGRALEAESILRAREDLETKGWIQRLLAMAVLQRGVPGEALAWIDHAIQDMSCQSHFHEFWELRYDVRNALGQRDAIEDLRKACSLAPVGPIKDRLGGRLSVACG